MARSNINKNCNENDDSDKNDELVIQLIASQCCVSVQKAAVIV